MFVSKNQIKTAVNEQARDFQEWRKVPEHRCIGAQNKMVGCVFVQRMSPHRFFVGWRFTPKGTPVGQVQQDCHAAYDKAQVIHWVEC